MGSGSYSINSNTGDYDPSVRLSNHTSRGVDYKKMSLFDTFKQRSVNNAMNPYGVTIRESRDSEEHPNSVAVIIALDVTGSMGSIPHYLIKEGLPNIMGSIIQKGLKDPQVLFLAIGDHTCDSAPLQVGQFESSDELLDHWLENVYLEGHGGGNDGESYSLAWYFAGKHTSIDCFEKRKQKGILFTIGDEPVLHDIPENSLKRIMGDGQYDKVNNVFALLDKAQEKYHIFHLHLKQGSNGQRQEVIDGWKQILGNNLLVIDRKEDIEKIISDKINELTKDIRVEIKVTKTDNEFEDNKPKEEIML